MRILLLILNILVLSQALKAQTLNYRVADVVPTPVTDEIRIEFDRAGEMMIGTNSGFYVYNCYNLQSFRSTASRPGLLPSNNVIAITEDHNDHIWLGTRNGLVCVDKPTGKTKIYHLKNQQNQFVYTLYTDRKGVVWIGTDDGLTRYDASTDSFHHFERDKIKVRSVTGEKESLGSYSVKSIVEDKRGNMFIGTWSAGVYRIEKDGSFVHYPRVNEMNSAYALFFDSRNRMWIGSWGYGMACLDNPYHKGEVKYRLFNNTRSDFRLVYKFIEDPISHTIWAATRHGVSIIDIDHIEKGFQNYSQTSSQPEASIAFCNDIATDGHGNIWLATINNGVKHISTVPSPLRNCIIDFPQFHLPVINVRSIFTADGNNFWLGLYPMGLAFYNRNTQKAIYNRDIPGMSVASDAMMISTFAAFAQRKNGELWMASNGCGILVREPSGIMRVIDINHVDYLIDDYVNTLFTSHDGKMWIGQRNGLSVVDANNKGRKVKLIAAGQDYSFSDVRGIMEDREHNLWISTDNQGVILLKKDGKVDVFNPDNKRLVVGNIVNCLEDSRHLLWAISSSGGLFLYNKTTNSFEEKNQDFHLSDSRIYSITEDQWGYLWLATDDALVRIETKDGKTAFIASAGTADGIGDLLFSANGIWKYGNELYFGNRHGFYTFVPSKNLSVKNNSFRNVIISNIYVGDHSLSELDSLQRMRISPLSPGYTREIVIPADVDKFAFEFALVSYNNPETTKYAYRLEDYEDEWHFTDAGQRRATYENIPSGTYHFHLKAIDSYGQETLLPYSITVRVLPPWYASWWAIIIYLLLLTGAVFGSIRWYKNYLKTKNRLAMNTIFTNITHELLTPLTVISASVDDLRSQAPQFEHNYGLMQNNITRLTRLLRQILEVRKSQAGQLKLLVSQGNLSSFVKDVCENIRPMAHKRDSIFDVEIQRDDITGWFDSDKIDKILYNLLSNAMKYNKQGGHIKVLLSEKDGNAVLSVADEGIGMSGEKLRNLYTRFLDGDYRRMKTTGTGIGLALTHDLVVLHHGTIDCQSLEGKGTTFTVTLPLSRDAFAEYEIDKLSNEMNAVASPNDVLIDLPELNSQTEMNSEGDEYKLLLVEDNEELLGIMQRLLGKKYSVITAKNGQQAWNMIQKNELDLVVSDVMMPFMDGIELTNLIKTSDDYGQLPVVLLTAKTRDEDRDEAYQTGADEYITKPFKLEYLQLRIDNIIANRRRIRQKFASLTEYKVEEQHYSNPEEVFMTKATQCVMAHLDDSEYDRAKFAAEMFVSESTLYNKLRAITGQSIVGFINSIRLKEAVKIMRQNPNITIVELSQSVGFNTPKYFSKCFKEEFGELPSEFIKKISET